MNRDTIKLEIPYKYTQVELNTSLSGSLAITLSNNKEVRETLLEALLATDEMDDLMALKSRLDIQQLKELSEYYQSLVS